METKREGEAINCGIISEMKTKLTSNTWLPAMLFLENKQQ